MLLLTGEHLPWSPGLNQLFPRPFKHAVRTLLFISKATQPHEVSKGDTTVASNETPEGGVGVLGTQVENGVEHGVEHGGAEGSSHYSDAESGALEESPACTPGSGKRSDKALYDEEEVPMYTPFDVWLSKGVDDGPPFGSDDDDGQDGELDDGTPKVPVEPEKRPPPVHLPQEVMLKIVSCMAFPVSAWLIST